MPFRILPLVLLAVVLGALATVGFKPASALTLDEVFLIIREEGLDAGFARVRREYKTTPEFRGDCHRFMLDVGERASTEFPELETTTYSPLSVTCNYGFFQAYPYGLLLATKDVGRAKTYCLRVGEALKVKVPSAQAECFRGIGRALPFLDESSFGNAEAMATSAVNICDSIAGTKSSLLGIEADHELCVSGAFNMLGRATAEGQYGLRTSPARPFKLCELIETEDTRLRCYGNFKWSLLTSLDFSNPAKAFETFSTTDGSREGLASVAWSIGYDYVLSNLGFEDIHVRALSMCHTLPEEWQIECVHGAAIAFTKHGFPGNQHEDLIAFCSSAKEEGINPSSCIYSQTMEYLQGFYSPAKFARACRAFEKNFEFKCPRT